MTKVITPVEGFAVTISAFDFARHFAFDERLSDAEEFEWRAETVRQVAASLYLSPSEVEEGLARSAEMLRARISTIRNPFDLLLYQAKRFEE